MYYQGHTTISIRFNLKYKLLRNFILVQAETTWLPVNDNYKEINLESEKMEIYGHWFNMKNLLFLRKSVSGSYPTSKTQFLPFHIFLKYFQMKVLILIYDLKLLIAKLWSLNIVYYQFHLKWEFRNEIPHN